MEEDEFKDTEIGRIPKEWEIKTLKDIYTVKYGKSHKKSNNGEIPVIGSSGIYSYTDIYLAKSDVIIIGRKGNAGKVYFIDKNCWPSDTTFYIEPTTLLISKFTYYYLYNLNISGNDAKTTLPSLQKGTVESIILIIPPLEEQKIITYVLSKIENAIKIQDRIINSLQELKKSMMHKLFTEGIGHTEFKDTEIGRIPKEWDIFKLEDIAMVFSGNTAPQEEKYFKNGKYPFIRVRHLTKLENYKYPLKYDLINDEAVTVLKLRKFKRGSIIFPKSGESIKLEKRAILKEDSYIVNHLAVIEPTKKINNLFLFYYLNTVKTNNYLVGTSMPSLQLSVIKKFLIPIPSPDEQNRIAYILSAIDNIISIEEDRKKYFEALFKTMLNKLMTGQIRVKNLEMREND